MLVSFLLILVGMILLYVGAELLIRSVVQIALYFKISKLVIGLTIVAFATSIPEAMVSFFGQFVSPSGDLALGNVIGSNIANIGFVLGFCLLISPCSIDRDWKWQKMPTLFLIYFIVFLIMLGGKISRLEGIYLFIALILFNIFQYLFPPQTTEVAEEIKLYQNHNRSNKKLVLALVGLILAIGFLPVGTQSLLHGALQIARSFGISERVISISVLAIGTSLPELATCIIASLRKHSDIVLATLIGSNIFNPLFIIPISTMVHPIYFSPNMLLIDYPVMVAFSLLLWVLMLKSPKQLSKIHGGILLLSYCVYIFFLYLH